MATLILMLVAVGPSDGKFNCMLAAALLHYFMLSTFLWMLMEGVLLYTKIARAGSASINITMKKAAMVAWGE